MFFWNHLWKMEVKTFLRKTRKHIGIEALSLQIFILFFLPNCDAFSRGSCTSLSHSCVEIRCFPLRWSKVWKRVGFSEFNPISLIRAEGDEDSQLWLWVVEWFFLVSSVLRYTQILRLFLWAFRKTKYHLDVN